MKKEELATLLGSGGKPADLGPIEVHLRAIAHDEDLPDFAIAMCAARIEESGPALRTVLVRAADGEVLSEDEGMLVFRGLYILGGARDTEAWPILLRLLRQSLLIFRLKFIFSCAGRAHQMMLLSCLTQQDLYHAHDPCS